MAIKRKAKSKKPRAKRKSTRQGGSPLEAEMLKQMRLCGLWGEGWEREYKFHPIRRWRMDFANPDLMIGLEVEGGIYGRGRHTSVKGFTADCAKYNAAAIMGWRVIRVVASMIKDGSAIAMVEAAIKAARDERAA